VSAPVAVYADGGLLRVNPSPIGGMWAWCHVDQGGARVRSASGMLLVDEIGAAVTNHHTENLALLLGLEALPDGWSGRVCTDSLNALRVFCHEGRVGKLPSAWYPRIGRVLARLGRLEPVLLKGHPTRAELTAGVGTKRGRDGVRRTYPVSEHNDWCDRACSQAGLAYMRATAPAGAPR
jgi:hypothetical protein